MGLTIQKPAHEAIALREAHAIIPRRNAKPWKTNRLGVEARNEILRATRRLGEPYRKSGAATTDVVW
jgi:hypothetical protein